MEGLPGTMEDLAFSNCEIGSHDWGVRFPSRSSTKRHIKQFEPPLLSQVSAHRLPHLSQSNYSTVFGKEVHVRHPQIRLVSLGVVCVHDYPLCIPWYLYPFDCSGLFFRDSSWCHLVCICVYIVCLSYGCLTAASHPLFLNIHFFLSISSFRRHFSVSRHF